MHRTLATLAGVGFTFYILALPLLDTLPSRSARKLAGHATPQPVER
jgi:hypothetical protein